MTDHDHKRVLQQAARLAELLEKTADHLMNANAIIEDELRDISSVNGDCLDVRALAEHVRIFLDNLDPLILEAIRRRREIRDKLENKLSKESFS
jgi:hypothetical protein